MSYVRRDIVQAFTNAIKNANTIARKNVSSFRVNKTWFEDLPAVNIYATHESAGIIFSDAPLSFKRNLEISVECIVSGKNEDIASELLDKLLAQVEESIGMKYSYDKGFRNLFTRYYPTEVEFDFSENASQIVAGGKINYLVEYVSEAVTNEPRLDDLSRFGVTYVLEESTTLTEDLNEFPI